MNCIDYRRLLTSDPSHGGAEGLRHRMQCRSCATFADEMQQFDGRLRDAMTFAVPDGLESRIMLAAAGRSSQNRRWLAVAATLVLGVAATLALLDRTSIDRLPEQVVNHLYHEADLLVPVSTSFVPRQRLIQVLERTGVRLTEDVSDVIHAGVCPFRGHLVSHLVVNSELGPVTVLLLPKEKVDRTMPIDEDGFKGVIVPVAGGSIAIVGSKTAFPVQQQLQNQFVRAVEWET